MSTKWTRTAPRFSRTKAIAFVLENRKQVSVHFVFATARVSLVWLILLAVGIGLLGGILAAQLERRRRRRSHEAPEH